MHCHKDLLISLWCYKPYPSASGWEYLCHILPCLFSRNTVVGLVADLDHSDIHAAVYKTLKALFGKFFYRLCLLINTHRHHGLRSCLFAGICPEIRIMEVYKDLHSCIWCPYAYLSRNFKITVSAAVDKAYFLAIFYISIWCFCFF